ncbi:MAG: Gfo/Idh/MocA family oxidoreductase [Candidatus Omnitrophica bacterium]|nr:Gfo/Idh/MocA family oxidoreductase [Candidatus Omnitrophota bacterium]
MNCCPKAPGFDTSKDPEILPPWFQAPDLCRLFPRTRREDGQILTQSPFSRNFYLDSPCHTPTQLSLPNTHPHKYKRIQLLDARVGATSGTVDLGEEWYRQETSTAKLKWNDLLGEYTVPTRLLPLLLAASYFFLVFTTNCWAAEQKLPLKAGIIGLDAHALPWTKIINSPQASGELADLIVVAGFPGGSSDIRQSLELREKSVGALADLGVEIVDSIDDLLAKVDVVMILSIDGRAHLEQAKPVFAAGKPVFIDKPIAASLAEAIAIFRLAKESNVPCFTSSSLRYAERTLNIRQDPLLGELVGCDQYAPCSLEPHHPDFFWYGIHGVEPLFTIMGPGCVSVTRVHTEGTDMAVGVWNDGRIGTFRGIREGQRGYGSTVFGSKGIVAGGGFDGYEPLIVEIVKFFKTGKPPVSEDETLEIFAFMEAAEESKRQGGCPVRLESVMKNAQAQASEIK